MSLQKYLSVYMYMCMYMQLIWSVSLQFGMELPRQGTKYPGRGLGLIDIMVICQGWKYPIGPFVIFCIFSGTLAENVLVIYLLVPSILVGMIRMEIMISKKGVFRRE